MGDSTVVVGDEKTIKVHVHVKDPGEPISYGISLGRIADVVVENMQMQMEEIIDAKAPLEKPAVDPGLQLEPGQIGVVAVAAGEGLADIFRSLGAAGIVSGGQSNNPSTEDIFEVVQQIPVDDIVILPNNKNIIMCSRAVSELSDKNISVVPSRTVPQGISALLALNHEGEYEETVSAMHEALGHVASGELATATRSVVLEGIDVEEGQTIGVANGRLCASGHDLDQVLGKLLDEMDMADRELVSVYYGQEVSEQDAQQIADRIESLYSDVEVEVLPGGQAIYQYIIGAE
jgi:dihydroxyacetone kinase-like predicted kinase